MLTLSPQARAIAALLLGFAYVTGSMSSIGIYFMLAITRLHHVTNRGTNAGIDLVMLLVGAAIFLLAARYTRGLADSWPRWVAQAGQLMAVAGVLITLVTLLAAVAGRTDVSLSTGIAL